MCLQPRRWCRCSKRLRWASQPPFEMKNGPPSGRAWAADWGGHLAIYARTVRKRHSEMKRCRHQEALNGKTYQSLLGRRGMCEGGCNRQRHDRSAAPAAHPPPHEPRRQIRGRHPSTSPRGLDDGSASFRPNPDKCRCPTLSAKHWSPRPPSGDTSPRGRDRTCALCRCRHAPPGAGEDEGLPPSAERGPHLVIQELGQFLYPSPHGLANLVACGCQFSVARSCSWS